MQAAEQTRRRLLAAGLYTGLGAGLGACALGTDHNHTGPDAPDSRALQQTPRVAWVLSSGGPRGFVHVGVLMALDELGVKPDLLVGASVGALLAVLRAAGYSGAELQQLALDLGPLELARLTRLARVFDGPGERLSGAGVAELVREKLLEKGPSSLLQDLPLPALCVVQRLADGSTRYFNHGDAGLAVQASTAIEGQFTPVRIRGRRYADADLRTPLPVRLARSLGAQRVLAIDASAHEAQAPAGAGRYRQSDQLKRRLTQPDADAADISLHPFFGYWVNLSTEFRQRAIEAGYRATWAHADRIRALHA